MTGASCYVLTFRPRPSAVPAPVRLRAVLKYALRVQGLVCVAAEELPSPAESQGAGAAVTAAPAGEDDHEPRGMGPG